MTGPFSREKKLGVIVKALRRTKWSLKDMIEAWVGTNGPQDVRVQHRRYHKQKQRRSAMMRVMRPLAQRGICQEVSLDTRCAFELDVLVSRTPFSKFFVDMTLESLDDAQAASIIKEVAPTWYSLPQLLLRNRRHHRATYGCSKQLHHHPTAYVCHYKHGVLLVRTTGLEHPLLMPRHILSGVWRTSMCC